MSYSLLMTFDGFCVMTINYEKFEDTKKGYISEAVIWRTKNTMAKRESAKIIHKILHRKLKIEQHEPHWICCV